MPDLRREIVTQRIFTPKDFKSRAQRAFGLGVFVGAALDAERLFSRSQSRPKYSGLYFVGAGTHPGAGIPGVVNSAKATAGLILQDFAAELARRRQQRSKELSYA